MIIKDFNEDNMAAMFPEIPSEDRVKSAYGFTQNLRVVARIFDRMDQEGKIPKNL